MLVCHQLAFKSTCKTLFPCLVSWPALLLAQYWRCCLLKKSVGWPSWCLHGWGGPSLVFTCIRNGKHHFFQDRLLNDRDVWKRHIVSHQPAKNLSTYRCQQMSCFVVIWRRKKIILCLPTNGHQVTLQISTTQSLTANWEKLYIFIQKSLFVHILYSARRIFGEYSSFRSHEL